MSVDLHCKIPFSEWKPMHTFLSLWLLLSPVADTRLGFGDIAAGTLHSALTSQQEKSWPPWADDATQWLTCNGGSCTWLRKNTGGPGLEGKAIGSVWPVFSWKSMSHFNLKLEIESKTKLPSQTQF